MIYDAIDCEYFFENATHAQTVLRKILIQF